MREHICVHTHNVLSYMFTKIILQNAGTSTVHIYTHEHQNWYSLQTRCSMVLHCKVGYRFIISINLNSYNVENCGFSLTYSYICMHVCKDITYMHTYAPKWGNAKLMLARHIVRLLFIYTFCLRINLYIYG